MRSVGVLVAALLARALALLQLAVLRHLNAYILLTYLG